MMKSKNKVSKVSEIFHHIRDARGVLVAIYNASGVCIWCAPIWGKGAK